MEQGAISRRIDGDGEGGAAALIDRSGFRGRKTRTSELGMFPSPVGDQSLSPSLFFERTSTS